MIRGWLRTALAGAGLVLVAGYPGESQSAARVRVAEGALLGERLGNGVTAFRGVPYAAAPVDERRWRPPAAPAAWDGERDATAFAPACPQHDGTGEYYRRAARRLARDPEAVPGPGDTSEDCLYLNIWTPAVGSAERLPIFVWVHGGAGTGGSAADPLFDGAALASHGMVVITVAYRLGALGFLAHPALVAALRKLPAASLLDVARRAPAEAPSMPVVDGLVLREPPARRFERAAFTPVPILTGFTDDETALFAPPLPVNPEEYRAWVRQRFGSEADTLLAAYAPGDDGESTRRQRVRFTSDEGFRAPALLLVQWTEGRNPVYLYRFSWRPDDGAVGAFHSAELPFLFSTHGLWWGDDPGVRRVTRTMQAAWTRFAAPPERLPRTRSRPGPRPRGTVRTPW